MCGGAVNCSPIYNALDDEPGPTPWHQPVPLGSNHSHHCGTVLGSPSRPGGPASSLSIGPIDVPQGLSISPRAPKASMTTVSDAVARDESHRGPTLGGE